MRELAGPSSTARRCSHIRSASPHAWPPASAHRAAGGGRPTGRTTVAVLTEIARSQPLPAWERYFTLCMAYRRALGRADGSKACECLRCSGQQYGGSRNLWARPRILNCIRGRCCLCDERSLRTLLTERPSALHPKTAMAESLLLACRRRRTLSAAALPMRSPPYAAPGPGSEREDRAAAAGRAGMAELALTSFEASIICAQRLAYWRSSSAHGGRDDIQRPC